MLQLGKRVNSQILQNILYFKIVGNVALTAPI